MHFSMAAIASIAATPTTSPFSADARLLLSAALGKDGDCVRALAAEVTDWPRLYRFADGHGLRAAAYHGLARAGVALPAEVAGPWRSFAEENAFHSLQLSRELLRIVAALEAGGVRVLPYKGPSLGAAAHPSLAARESTDLDLLVSPADALLAEQIAVTLGYAPLLRFTTKQRTSYLRNECELDMVTAAGELLDLHWALVPRHYQMRFDFEAWWRRRVPLSIGGCVLPTLAPEDGALALAVHGCKHSWERLSWVVDLVLWLRAHAQLNWAELALQAKQLGAERALRVGLLMCHAADGTAVPEPVRIAAAADFPASQLAAAAVRRINRGDAIGDSERWRTTLRLLPGRRARLRCLASFAVTSGVAEWKSVRLPDAFFAVYVPLRLLRIVRAALRERWRK